VVLAIPATTCGNSFLRLEEGQTYPDTQYQQHRNGENPAHELENRTTCEMSFAPEQTTDLARRSTRETSSGRETVRRSSCGWASHSNPDDRDYLWDGGIYRLLLQGVILCNSGTWGDPLTGAPLVRVIGWR
jgi:hypothetical protein